MISRAKKDGMHMVYCVDKSMPLRQGATKQISDYEQRFSTLKKLYDEMLANLVRNNLHEGV